MIGKLARGAGIGMGQVGQMALGSQIEENRQKRLMMLKASMDSTSAEATYQRERQDKLADTETSFRHDIDKEFVKASLDAWKEDQKSQGTEHDPAEVKTMRWMIENKIATDANDAWDKYRSQRTDVVSDAVKMTQIAMKEQADNYITPDDEGYVPADKMFDKYLSQFKTKPDTTNPVATTKQNPEPSKKPQGFQPDTSKPQGSRLNPFMPQSEQDYASVPVGAIFIDPGDGKAYPKIAEPQKENPVDKLRPQADIDKEKYQQSDEYKKGVIAKQVESAKSDRPKESSKMAEKFGLDANLDSNTRGNEYAKLASTYQKVMKTINSGVLPENIQEVKDALRFAEGSGNTDMANTLQAILKRLGAK